MSTQPHLVLEPNSFLFTALLQRGIGAWGGEVCKYPEGPGQLRVATGISSLQD